MAEIGIIIPTYNAEAYLSKAIESVIGQIYSDWKLIVIDDGSRDSSFEIAKRYAELDPRISAHAQSNSGVAVARNNGLKLCQSSRFVLFLDNDDYLEYDALSTLHSTLISHPNAVAAYGFPRIVEDDGISYVQPIEKAYGFQRHTIAPNRKMATLAPGEPDQFANLVIWPSVLTPGQMLIRANALAAIEPFDPATVPSDDWDLCIRLSLQGPLQRVLQFTMNKRSHATNVSKQGKVMAVGEPSIRNKLAASALPQDTKQLARLGHLYSCWFKISWASKQRSPVDAAKALYRGLKSYMRYLYTDYHL